ncbi:hypothetical protein A3197_16950 [Candidatus Thiodiazotropha endoloripes]|nr:hypothetical protein A3197_16950 [Candidatus Thiodiazotropha endoloripes]
MSFIVIFNSAYITCCSDNLILSPNDIVKLSSSENVLDYIRSLKNIEENKLKQSIKEGYEAGYKEGFKKAEKDLNTQFKSYLEDLTESIISSRIETDQEIVALACNVIKKIAENIKPSEMVQSLAITAINNLQNKRELQIKVNPEYVEDLQQKIHSINQTGNDDYSGLDIRSDQSLGKFDIIIKSQTGETIASFDDQLKLIKENMIEELVG